MGAERDFPLRPRLRRTSRRGGGASVGFCSLPERIAATRLRPRKATARQARFAKANKPTSGGRSIGFYRVHQGSAGFRFSTTDGQRITMDSFFPKIGMESQCLNRINQRLVTSSPTFKRYVKERGHVKRGERGFNTSCHDKRGKHGDFTIRVAKVIVSDYRNRTCTGDG
jgi:hypothetical protein